MKEKKKRRKKELQGMRGNEGSRVPKCCNGNSCADCTMTSTRPTNYYLRSTTHCLLPTTTKILPIQWSGVLVIALSRNTYTCTYRSMCACMSACMHACMHMCMCACTYACIHVCIHACMHVCMQACVHVCMRARMHV